MNKKSGPRLELIVKFFNQAEKYFMAKIQALAMKIEERLAGNKVSFCFNGNCALTQFSSGCAYFQ